jgi:hypothetical protein
MLLLSIIPLETLWWPSTLQAVCDVYDANFKAVVIWERKVTIGTKILTSGGMMISPTKMEKTSGG